MGESAYPPEKMGRKTKPRGELEGEGVGSMTRRGNSESQRHHASQAEKVMGGDTRSAATPQMRVCLYVHEHHCWQNRGSRDRGTQMKIQRGCRQPGHLCRGATCCVRVVFAMPTHNLEGGPTPRRCWENKNWTAVKQCHATLLKPH